jgi:enoyl-CoA hydratase
MQTAVLSAVRSAALDPAVRAILLTGAGPALSAGGDFGLIRRTQDDPEVRRNVLDPVASRLASLPPAAVQATKRALNRYLAAAETPVFELALAAESTSLDTVEHREAIERLARSSAGGVRENEKGKAKEQQ